MTRLDKVMGELKNQNKKGLFIYLMAGVPDEAGTIEAVKSAERAGANVIELGIPFSDPLADGPVIQKAGIQAIQNGMNLHRLLKLIEKIRCETQTPLIGMGYINNIMHYGTEKFVKDFKNAGLDGMIIPDVPHEESVELPAICKANNFHLIEFVTPGTTVKRMKETCSSADGFIYAVSVNGVTGARDGGAQAFGQASEIDYSVIGKVVELVKQETNVPLAVGFGIGSPDAAVAAAKHADAVIVGSAVVSRILDGKLDEAEAFVASLRTALDSDV